MPRHISGCTVRQHRVNSEASWLGELAESDTSKNQNWGVGGCDKIWNIRPRDMPPNQILWKSV